MYELCLYNRPKNKFFKEIIDSPFLLRKRLNKIKKSKKIEISYFKRLY